MKSTKKINPAHGAFFLIGLRTTLDIKAYPWWDSLPEDEVDGVEIDFSDIQEAINRLEKVVTTEVEGLFKQSLPEPIEPPAPVEPEPVEPEPVEYRYMKRVGDLRLAAGKMFTWLYGMQGLSGRVKFVWPECNYELIVPDGTVTHGADGNSKNHNQAFYFCGTDFEPHESENNNEMPSVFAPPGCKATYVEVWYN